MEETFHMLIFYLCEKNYVFLIGVKLCYGQRMSPLNCSVLQIIFYELRI